MKDGGKIITSVNLHEKAMSNVYMGPISCFLSKIAHLYAKNAICFCFSEVKKGNFSQPYALSAVLNEFR